MGENGEVKVGFHPNKAEPERFALTIDDDRIEGRSQGIEHEVVAFDDNLYGVAYELGGRAGVPGLDLKNIFICSANEIRAIAFGKNDCIMAAEEDVKEGFIRIQESAAGLFANRNTTIVGFNLGNLIMHLSGMGCNLGASFVDLSIFGIKNWEKAVLKHLNKTKIKFLNPAPSEKTKYCASACFARRIHLRLNQ